jgi:hypothetical protein
MLEEIMTVYLKGTSYDIAWQYATEESNKKYFTVNSVITNLEFIQPDSLEFFKEAIKHAIDYYEWKMKIEEDCENWDGILD